MVLALAALVLCTATAATGTAPARWCRAPTPASWKLTLARSVVSLSRHVAMQPIGGAGDGRGFFAELWSPAWSGVVRVDARTSRVTHIRRFPNAHDDQADGSFDGRWFVWSEYHSLADGFADFTTFAWDSRTGGVKQIGAAARGPNGDFWPGQWRQPDVRAGLATWAQGAGPDERDVHVYDLAQDHDLVVRHGHTQGSFFVAGPLVVWPESLSPGAYTRMLAADPRTGASVPTPPALADLRGISALFTDGHVLVYPSAKFKSIWWAPSLHAKPQRVFKPKPGLHYVDNSVRVAGRYFLFSSEGHYYLGDGRARRYMELGAYGMAIDRRSLIVVRWPKGKRLHPKGVEMVVPLRSLPRLSRCAR
jgi:hypothetical protein